MTELQIDRDALLKDMPGYDTLKRFEPLARITAFTKEGSAIYLNNAWLNKSKKTEAGTVVEMVEVLPITVESKVAGMRKFLSEREEWWSLSMSIRSRLAALERWLKEGDHDLATAIARSIVPAEGYGTISSREIAASREAIQRWEHDRRNKLAIVRNKLQNSITNS